MTGFAVGVTLLSRGGPEVLAWVAGGTFVAGFLLFNSRAGRTVDETLTDWAMRNWDWLRADVLPGLVHYTMVFFKRCLDTLEKLIYSVDEWLRFRSGDGRWSLFFKPILGMLWRAVTYFLRVLIALFVEPTFNPIKHFPAVTVAAKLMVPFFPLIHVIFMGPVADILGTPIASILEGLVIFFFPGLAGFMAWELKENWKLYASNRKTKLDAVPIGSHGETITRFFKPGFHSGTLPRLFQKLRKAEREANGRAFFKHHEALHHVVEDLRNFLERELLMLLHASKAWGETPMYVGMMQLASNRIKVEICSTNFGQRGFWLTFEWQSEWLLAGIEKSGWIPQLNSKQTKALRVALAGLYKLAGVQLIREQLRTQLPEKAKSYQLADEEILLYLDSDFKEDERISLTDEYLYTDNEINWQEWIGIWKADQDDTLEKASFLDSVHILPSKETMAHH